MNTKTRILQLCHMLRTAQAPGVPDMIMSEVFTTGNCGNLALALKLVFPEVKLMQSNHHCCVELNGEYFDINGVYVPAVDCYAEELAETTEEAIRAHDFVDNYSYAERGPII